VERTTVNTGLNVAEPSARPDDMKPAIRLSPGSEAPPGTEISSAQCSTVAIPDLGVMLAAIARHRVS